MGKIIARDFINNGFTYRHDDGTKEHFTKNLVTDGYTGDKGSKITASFLGGYTLNYKGNLSKFRI